MFRSTGKQSGESVDSVLKRRLVWHYLSRNLTRAYRADKRLGSRVVSVLDSGAEGPGFKSQSRRCRVTVLGKLFTHIVPSFTKQQNW